MQEYIGTCHCGDTVYAFQSEAISKGLRCTCSICKRLGVIHSPKIAPELFKIVSGKSKLKTYLHGDKDIHFSFCGNCGVYVFYTSDDRCRVNLACVDSIDTCNLKIDIFDGKNLL
jgi:hypothetical protein